MAEQTYYIGSLGPFYYDDEDVPVGIGGTRRFSIIDSGMGSGGTGAVQPGDEVVTDVTLSIDFSAETFTLTVTKKPLGNPLMPNDGH
jgi:hypothetical protein